MPTKSSTPSESTDFVLKHRVAGAACLIFFGALVLPWLLGPPNHDGVEVNSNTAGTVLLGTNNIGAANVKLNNALERSKQPQRTALLEQKNLQQQDSDSIENELLNSVDDELENTQETVYISKITPADGKKDLFRDRPDDNQVIESVKKSLPLKNETVANTKPVPAATDVKKEAAVAAIANIESSTEPKNEDNEPVAAEPLSTLTEKPKPAIDKIDIGWVVQVGVFTDKKGASKVVDDLQSKGFKPSITTVDTNRGKATGTRVWLGPFAQRVEAAKTKTRLTKRTGEPGFIRPYP